MDGGQWFPVMGGDIAVKAIIIIADAMGALIKVYIGDSASTTGNRGLSDRPRGGVMHLKDQQLQTLGQAKSDGWKPGSWMTPRI